MAPSRGPRSPPRAGPPGVGDQEPRYRLTVVDALTATRTTVDGPITRFAFSPWHVSYHIEHHPYPSVPALRLRRLHAALARNPAYQALAHVTHGHVALMRELVGSSRHGAARGPAAGGSK